MLEYKYYMNRKKAYIYNLNWDVEYTSFAFKLLYISI